MANVWVYKADGTLQCSTHGGIPAADMQKDLEQVVGPVMKGEKRKLCGFIIQQCGAPTGNVNAYELTPLQAYLLFHGFIGPRGFRLWTCDWPSKDASVDAMDHTSPFPIGAVLAAGGSEEGRKAVMTRATAGGDVPFPLSIAMAMLAEATSVDTTPVMIRELYGRLCRVYQSGDGLTMDYIPQRVNIELDNRRIVRIWFG